MDLISLIENHSLSPHLYADDTQVYGSCPPTVADSLSSRVSECINAIASWTRSNRLQLNPDKTEVLWCATSRRQHQLPTADMLIDDVAITPVPFVRDLGIYIDADLSMRTHVQRTVSRCLNLLRCPTSAASDSPIGAHNHVSNARGCAGALPTGLRKWCAGRCPSTSVYRLQSVLNASARLIFNLRRSDHISGYSGYGSRSAYSTRSPC